MRSKLATLALAGSLGLTGVAGAALLVPAVSYAATGDGAALTERVSSLASALSGLVSDGTITQAQADRVARTLAEARPEGGRHGHGRGRGGRVDLTAAAQALGLTEDELRAQLADGKTLADVAEAEGVEQDVLVDALVAAARERLAEAVSSGRLTQAQADERAADLEARVTDSLDELCGPGGPGGGRRGGPTEAPSETPSETPSEAPGTAPSATPSAGAVTDGAAFSA